MKKTSALLKQKPTSQDKTATAKEKTIIYQHSDSGRFISGTTFSTSSGDNPPFSGYVTIKQHKPDEIERAVLAHIRAIRTLGRMEVNTLEIAEALALPVSDVNRVVDRLKGKGVKTL